MTEKYLQKHIKTMLMHCHHSRTVDREKATCHGAIQVQPTRKIGQTCHTPGWKVLEMYGQSEIDS